MFGLGGGELIVVLILALIFVGPEKLPKIGSLLGKFALKARRFIDEIKADLK